MTAGSLSAPTERRRGLGGSEGSSAVRSLVRRDWRIMRSYRTALVTDVLFGVLNLVAYYYISKTLKPRLDNGLDGAPTYFAFAAVGLALTIVLQAAITGVARRIREEQLTGTLEVLLVQPITSRQIAIGLAGFPFAFALIRAFIYLLLAGLFLGLSFARCDWLGLVVSFLVSGVAFASIGVGLSAIVLVFKRADALSSISSFILGLVGGALFPTRVLPQWLRPLSDIVPTRYAFDAVRSALFGHGSWLGPTAVLAGIAVLTAILAFAMFSQAVRLAIRNGTINQY